MSKKYLSVLLIIALVIQFSLGIFPTKVHASGTSGTGFPTTVCAVNDTYTQTDASNQIWTCLATNVWTNNTTGVTSSGQPANNTGLLARYRMVDASGTNLPDTSGNGNNGTFGADGFVNPSITSQGVNFSSSYGSQSQGIGLPTSLWPTVGTVIVYYKPSDTFPTNHSETILDPWGAGGITQTISLRPADSLPSMGYDSNPSTVAPSQLWKGMTPLAVTFSTSSTSHMYYQGTEVSGYMYQGTAAVNGTPSMFTIGERGYNTQVAFNGTIAYLEMYNRVLSQSEINTETARINAELALRSGVTLGNTVTNNKPLLLFDGTSISEGYLVNPDNSGQIDGTNSWVGKTYTSLGVSNYLIRNFGIAGQGISQGLAKIQSTIGNIVAGTTQPTIVITDFGSNDILGSNSVPTLETNIASYCSAVHSYGSKCIVTTFLPRTVGSSGATFVSNRTLYNTWLRSNYSSFADGLIDWASDATIGGDAAASSTTYYVDGVHPTAAASTIMATYATTAIQNVMTIINAPQVSITAPTNGVNVSGLSVSLSANATAVTGATITSVQFKVDGANVGPAITSAPYTYGWNSTSVSNATHSIVAVATDSNSNTASSSAVSVVVNNTVGGSGVTYYVDSVSGSDGNTGTDTSHPWQTIAKVNGLNFNPGDQILFKRGDTWHEQLTVPSSGSNGNIITFGSYGTGTNPTISGSNLVTGWTVVSGAEYSATLASTPSNIYIDDQNNGTSTVPLTKTTSSALVASTAGSWYYTGTTLYIHLLDGSNPSGHAVEASVRQYGIYSVQHSFITIQNFNIKQATQAGIYFENNASPTGTADNYYNNNFNEFNTVQGNTIWNYGDGASDYYMGGIYVQGSKYQSAPPMLRGWQVLNNNIGRMDAPAIIMYFEGGIEVLGTTGALIQGNTVASVNNFGITVRDDYGGQSCYGALITGNSLGANQGSISIGSCPYTQITYNNISNSSGYGIGVGDNLSGSSNNITIAYNLIYNLTKSADGVLYNGIDVNGTSTINGQLYNNTIVKVTAESATLESNSAGWTVKNNLFDCRNNYDVAGVGTHGCMYINSGLTGLTFSNNMFSDLSGHLSSQFSIGGTPSNFVQLESYTGETNSKNISDPLFISTMTPNLALQPASPAIDSGFNLGSTYKLGLNPNSVWPTSVTTLDQNISGSGWEIGAFVYNTQPTAPIVSISTPSAGTVSGSVALSSSASATLPATVSSVQYYLDNVALSSTIALSPYNYTWDTTTATNASHTLTAVATDNYSSNTTSSPVTITVDNVVPFRSAGLPTTSLAANTTSTTLSITTDKTSTCAYSTTANTSYSSMTPFTSTNSTIHTTALSNLQNGTSYNYYVRCQDTLGNTNTTDYPISFSIATPARITSSGGHMILPSITTTTTPPLATSVCTGTALFNTLTGQPCGSITTSPTTPSTSSPQASGGQTYNLGTMTLRQSYRGSAVKQLQLFLNKNLNSNLVLDGIFGSKTTLLVKQWQTAHNLTPDGVVGPKTKAMMNASGN